MENVSTETENNRVNNVFVGKIWIRFLFKGTCALQLEYLVLANLL